MGDLPALAARVAEAEPGVSSVAIEAHNTERYVMTPATKQSNAERREQPLVHEYASYLREMDHVVVRHRYQPDRGRSLFCDLFDETSRSLVEAKGSVTREAIRMAIGQLADYGRFEPDGVVRRVLLPSRPRPDLEALLLREGIEITFPSLSGFEHLKPKD